MGLGDRLVEITLNELDGLRNAEAVLKAQYENEYEDLKANLHVEYDQKKEWLDGGSKALEERENAIEGKEFALSEWRDQLKAKEADFAIGNRVSEWKTTYTWYTYGEAFEVFNKARKIFIEEEIREGVSKYLKSTSWFNIMRNRNKLRKEVIKYRIWLGSWIAIGIGFIVAGIAI